MPFTPFFIRLFHLLFPTTQSLTTLSRPPRSTPSIISSSEPSPMVVELPATPTLTPLGTPVMTHPAPPAVGTATVVINGHSSTRHTNGNTSNGCVGVECLPRCLLQTPCWRRLVRFISSDGRMLLGEPTDDAIDMGLAVAKGIPVYANVLDAVSPWDSAARKTGEIAQVVKLLSPILPCEAGTIRATGLNYTDHAAELDLALPDVPAVFFKPATSIAHPGEPVPIPHCAQANEMDYEVELAVVIGRTCRDVDAADALDHVLGWTCANDLTARNLQKQCSQWGYSKGFDKFCPLGPCLVSRAALPDPRIVSLHTRVNGRLVQSGSADNMIWHVSEIVSYLSQGTTLPPGTVIITGTPPGIGASSGTWLHDGDEVRCTISHGIGTLVNTIVYD